MASKLSDEKIEKYKAMLEKAEPYPDDAPEMNTLDGDPADRDEDRVNASFAKKYWKKRVLSDCIPIKPGEGVIG